MSYAGQRGSSFGHSLDKGRLPGRDFRRDGIRVDALNGHGANFGEHDEWLCARGANATLMIADCGMGQARISRSFTNDMDGKEGRPFQPGPPLSLAAEGAVPAGKEALRKMRCKN